MNRPNVVGLRRLLTSLKENNRAHAAVLASLPVVSTRKASVQAELQLRSDGASRRNGFGKSAVLKSLYNALGAEPHRIDAFWRRAQVETLLDFSVDKKPYTCWRGTGATLRSMPSKIFSFAQHHAALN